MENISKNKIALFIVNYGVNKLTEDCYNSFRLENNIVKYILNNHNPSTKEWLNVDGINSIPYDENYGYFGALFKYFENNDKLDNYDWVILSNNDVFLESSNLAQSIIDLDTQIENLGVIAPSIKEPNGFELNPHHKKIPSLFWKLVFRFYFINYYSARLVHFLKKKLVKNKISRTEYNSFVFSPNGAFLIMKKSVLKRVLSEGNLGFLYGEEQLVAEVCSKLNMKVFFTDSIKFTHLHSQTTGVIFSKKKFLWQKQVFKQSLNRNYNFYKL
jgi:GT2 family glycosyltransferase